MYFLLFSHFLLCSAPSAISSALCCNHLLTSQSAQGTSSMPLPPRGRKIVVLWEDLLHKRNIGSWSPYLHLTPAPFRSALLPLHWFFALNKVLLHPSLRRLLFISSPRALPTSSRTKPGLNGHRGGFRNSHHTSLRKCIPSNTTRWHPVGFQPIAQALHLQTFTKQTFGHTSTHASDASSSCLVR